MSITSNVAENLSLICTLCSKSLFQFSKFEHTSLSLSTSIGAHSLAGDPTPNPYYSLHFLSSSLSVSAIPLRQQWQPQTPCKKKNLKEFGESEVGIRFSEMENRYYTTRGSVAGLGLGLDENGKAGGSIMMDGGERVGGSGGDENIGEIVWPKLYISLSSKEKEEDFMTIKGCKPPQRPKKRAKIIQRTLLLVSPGAWLSEMCQERYEVREKKSSKKELDEMKKLLKESGVVH